MSDYNLTLIDFLIFPTILCLSLSIGDRFLLILICHFSVCKLTSNVNTRSLHLVTTLVCTLFAWICVLLATIPSILSKWRNIVYFLCATNFLIHYQFWCIFVCDLLATVPKVVPILMTSTFPALCCFIISLTISNWANLSFPFLLCIFGFPIIHWCIRAKPEFVHEGQGIKDGDMETLWTTLYSLSFALVVIVFPLLAYILEVLWAGFEQDLWYKMSEFGLLLSLTQLFSTYNDLFPYTVSLQSVYRRRVLWISCIFVCSCILFTGFVDLSPVLLSDLVWIVLQIVSFSILIGTIYMQVYCGKVISHSNRIIITSSIFTCICTLIGFTRFPSANRISVWSSGLLQPALFKMVLLFTTACAVLIPVYHGQSNQSLLSSLVLAFLVAFQICEYYLYNSMLLSETYFLGSSFIIGALVVLCLQPHKISVQGKRHTPVMLTRSVIHFGVIIPMLMKMFLCLMNWLNRAPIESIQFGVKSAHPHIRLDVITLLGLYLSLAGLLCGPPSLANVLGSARTLCERSELIRVLINLAYTSTYFICSVWLWWDNILRSVVDGSPSVYFMPTVMLLSSFCLHVHGPFAGSPKGGYLDPVNQSSISRCLLIFSISVYWSVILIRRIHPVEFSAVSGLILVLFGQFMFFKLITSILLFDQGARLTQFNSWLVASLNWGLVTGSLLPIAFLWINPAMVNSGGFLASLTLFTSSVCVLIGHSVTNNFQGSSHASGVSSDNLVTTSIHHHPIIDDSLLKSGVKFRLLILFTGFVSLLLVYLFSLRWDIQSDSHFISALAIALYILGQASTGRFAFILQDRAEQQLRKCAHLSSIDKEHPITPTVPNTCYYQKALHSSINLTVFVAFMLLAYNGLTDQMTDIHFHFLPFLLYGFVGLTIPSVPPLCAFTLFLTTSTLINSHFSTTFQPPLTSFDEAFYRGTHSRWMVWAELSLTCLLLPVHFLFLSHLADLPCDTLANLSFCFLPKPQILQRLLTRSISYACAFIVFITHTLLLCCLAYLWIASSLSALIFGLYSFGVCSYVLLYVRIELTSTDAFQL